MVHPRQIWIVVTSAFGAACICACLASLAPAGPKADTGIAGAICPVVYPLDESSGERGIHYTFYGNAFFIDGEGYLLTAAHVLSDFRNGGEPHILLRRAEAPPRVVQVEVVATDVRHHLRLAAAGS